MNTMALKGDLLNLYVALALGGKFDEDLYAAFDEWGCGVVFKGNCFHPEQSVAEVWPQVMQLRISTVDQGNGQWLVSMPANGGVMAPAFEPFTCENPLDGYRYAIVWSVYGPTVPDTLQTQLFGLVNLIPFNVDFDEDCAVTLSSIYSTDSVMAKSKAL